MSGSGAVTGSFQRSLSNGEDREEFLSALQGEYARLFGQWEEKDLPGGVHLQALDHGQGVRHGVCRIHGSRHGGFCAPHAGDLSAVVPGSSRGIPEHARSSRSWSWSSSPCCIDRHRMSRLNGSSGIIWTGSRSSKRQWRRPIPIPSTGAPSRLIHLFLQQETKNGKVTDHGQKKIH